jgi:hypothetical protein
LNETIGRRLLQEATEIKDSTTSPATPKPSSPASGGFPKDMCADANDGKCEVKDKAFRLYEDTVLKIDKLESLILDNVNVTCLSKKGEYCSFEVLMTLKDKKA